MTHIAIQEKLDGKVVEWMEKVTDEQHLAEGGRAGIPEITSTPILREGFRITQRTECLNETL
jgi:hypothetical protein